jgi:serine/threonine protein kinase
MPKPAETEVHMPLPGSLIGPWRLLEYVGEGTYGIGYRCVRDAQPHAGQYALKWAKSSKDERFENEAELLSRIHHPNVPGLHDRGLWQGAQKLPHPYLVMDWAEGKPLYDWAKARGLTQRRACLLLAQVARALEATHVHGVHRDVKGDNVLVSSQGHVKLIDFGMCWYQGARPLTNTPIPPGTEPYRSHQLLRFRYQFRGDETAHYRFHPADDVYALGVTAYRLVTGLYPPPGTDPEHPDGPERPRPERLQAPSELATVGPHMDKLILRMLSAEREARGSAGELAVALERIAALPGPDGDLPIQPISSDLVSPRARDDGQRAPAANMSHRFRSTPLLPWFAIATASLSLATWTGWAALNQSRQEPAVARKEAAHASKQEGGTTGLGTAASTSSKVASPNSSAQQVLAEDTPPEPQQGQTRPNAAGQCPHKRQVVLNGACWAPLNGEREECDAAGGQLFKDRCYVPVMPTKRPPPFNPANTP